MRSNDSTDVPVKTTMTRKQYDKMSPIGHIKFPMQNNSKVLTPVTVTQNPGNFKFGIEGFKKEA